MSPMGTKARFIKKYPKYGPGGTRPVTRPRSDLGPPKTRPTTPIGLPARPPKTRPTSPIGLPARPLPRPPIGLPARPKPPIGINPGTTPKFKPVTPYVRPRARVKPGIQKELNRRLELERLQQQRRPPIGLPARPPKIPVGTRPRSDLYQRPPVGRPARPGRPRPITVEKPIGPKPKIGFRTRPRSDLRLRPKARPTVLAPSTASSAPALKEKGTRGLVGKPVALKKKAPSKKPVATKKAVKPTKGLQMGTSVITSRPEPGLKPSKKLIPPKRKESQAKARLKRQEMKEAKLKALSERAPSKRALTRLRALRAKRRKRSK